MSKEEIKRMVMRGNTGEYSHVIIVVDRFSYEDYPVYVRYDEDIRNVISQYEGNIYSLTGVMEVYNYNLDLEKQLNENRAYHIEPITKPKKESPKKEIEQKIDYKTNIDVSKEVESAIEYAKEMHKGQCRHDGTPYIKHPLNVLQNVLKYKQSKNLETLLISACLHDVIEDTSATYYDIFNKFGPVVAGIVLELTTDEDMKKALGKEQYLEYKMKNMTSWSLVIKLCDRLDNVSDLTTENNEEFRIKYINETINILDYLTQNRNLSKTHSIIINQIVIVLLNLCRNDITKINKLIEVFYNCSINNTDIKNNESISKDVIKKLTL